MAIERVQRLELIFPTARRDEVLAELHAASSVHIDEPGEEVLSAGAERASVSTDDLDAKVAALSTALEVIDQHTKLKKTLVESFFGVAPAASRAEVATAGGRVDVEMLGRTAGRLRDHWRGLAKQEADAQSELAALRPFVGLSFTGRDLELLKRAKAIFGGCDAEKFNALRLDPGAEMIAWEEVRRDGKQVWLLAAFRPADAEAARAKLREHGFDETAVPRVSGSVAERITELNKELERVNQGRDEVRREAAKLAAGRRDIELALAHWEDRRELRAAATRTAGLGRVSLLTGWVLEREAGAFKKVLAERLPCCSASFSEPTSEDDPPVSIKLPKLLKPMQLLVNMFGLPEYGSLDPTPYLSLSFLIFFGACFGDVVYGVLLMAVSGYVMIRYKHSWVKNFFQMFLYAGIFSTFFGLITVTWMGDLVSKEYLSEGNFLLRFAESCRIHPYADPMSKPLIALSFALILGVLNQLFGICLKMGMELRRKRYAAAFLDAGLWLVMLPGILLLIAPMFVEVPDGVFTAGCWLAGIGAAGLVLTQGRNEEGIVAKAVTGVVSLYGILGSYGTTSFIGDMLSYSRLLALGLTTTIIGMSFNIIAELCRTEFGGGAAAFVFVLLVGHSINFVMSILGAFVHPARLILLEFFGRFYESGGREFRPLALRSDRVELVERSV